MNPDMKNFEYKYEKPVEEEKWEPVNFDSDFAYSLVCVGDTQCLTLGDRLMGTRKLKQVYRYIADTAKERKVEHVFVLGDIIEVGYWNDANLVILHNDPPITEEWDLALDAILQLNDAGVPYSLCRGNHDDYMMDEYFGIPEYTDQFKDCGGFFSDSDAKYPKASREPNNPEGYVYWSAKSQKHFENSIQNSWKTVEICGTKYLFIAYDYNPSEAVAMWLDETLGKYPDHKVIIMTHSYLRADGEMIPSEKGEIFYPSEYGAKNMWEKVISKHANVFMVVCGHAVGADIPIYTIAKGDHGNKVYQFMINPQTYDTKERINPETGEIEIASGVQDTGLIMYMNFSADGKRISMNYYSTLLDRFLKGANYVIDTDSSVIENGNIDLASLSEFGQITPMITEKKTPELNGVIADGEYSQKKLSRVGDLDVIEHYAYDDKYIYYAFEANTGEKKCTLELHLGSNLYTEETINGDKHAKKILINFTSGICVQTWNDGFSIVRDGYDIFCSTSKDAISGHAVYEFKIRREYLFDNHSPDNLLSYALHIGDSNNRFYINDAAKSHLESLGLNKPFEWTYNYVYFEKRPKI